MPLKIIRQDITKISCDAIVNPSNRHLEPGGGADLAIHRAAGEALYKACKALGGCEVGKAKITPAFALPCKYVIHTAGPNFSSVKNPEELLASCYRECLRLAAAQNCETVAFPLIGAGAYGCPRDLVLRVATKTIGEFLSEKEMLVYLVVYDKDAYAISRKVFDAVTAYIDDNYVDAQSVKRNIPFARDAGAAPTRYSERRKPPAEAQTCYAAPLRDEAEATAPAPRLEDMIQKMDKGFADTLFFYIDKKEMTDVECYKRSNVDKKTFSKIKCNKHYNPSKITAVSFAIGLKLQKEEAEHLLRTAGYSLSNSNLFDVIIQYFITTGNYADIFDVNEVLYQFDQVTLGV